MKHGVALADVIAGKDAAIATLGALVGVLTARGRGEALPVAKRRVVVSLAASAAAALVNVAQNTLVSGAPPRRWGNAHANLVPYQLFEAADAPFVVAVGTDAQWRAAAQVLELGPLGDDPALATNAGRLAAREAIVAAIATAARRDTARAWCRRLEAAGVPCGVVRTVPDMLAELDGSALTGLPSPVGGTVRRSPPRLDEHGAEIRAAGGWSQS